MKYVLASVVVGDPDMTAARECPVCGFDALLDFPVYVLTGEGVSTGATFPACVRCFEERQ